GIRSGIVALTKADLADPDLLEIARLEVDEFVTGSFLEKAPVIAVSSKTGLGIEDLRAELAKAASKVVEKDAHGYFRLPIDRAFSLKGFGTVATGTLISGAVAREREVELYPTGRRLRVRGVQVYGSASDRALAGQRTALNLADIEPSEITRGMVLSEPGRFHATKHLDCRLELLRSAKPLKHRAPVHFHAGTAEIEAEVRLFGGHAVLQPGERAYARIVLREPTLLLPGDRFIIRKFSPVVTIGGGTVLDIAALRYRKSEDVAARLNKLETGDARARVDLLARESEFGISLADLIARTGLRDSEIPNARPWMVDRGWFQSTRDRLARAVRDFHRQNTLLPGMPKQDLKSRELPDAPAALLDELLADAKELVVEGENVRLRTHRLVLKEDEEHARTAIERAFEQAGLAVPALAEVLARSGVEAERARSLLQILIREKRLIRVADDLVFHQSAIANLRNLLAARKATRFNVGAFKHWTGVSRKYAIPLLEFLDRERVTRREGDERLIL
ncbi:MAG: SelB C-terminal domain-containing protein, partial [Acidobacteriota bacterium]|nr:SelB C-terminal domain-containing protein [Acidobacteriota bacterium]